MLPERRKRRHLTFVCGALNVKLLWTCFRTTSVTWSHRSTAESARRTKATFWTGKWVTRLLWHVPNSTRKMLVWFCWEGRTCLGNKRFDHTQEPSPSGAGGCDVCVGARCCGVGQEHVRLVDEIRNQVHALTETKIYRTQRRDFCQFSRVALQPTGTHVRASK